MTERSETTGQPNKAIFGEIRSILRHSMVYGLGSLTSKAIGFLMIPIYTRYLSPSDYGVIELLDLIVAIAGLILYDLIIEAVFRFYYQYQTPKERLTVVSTALLTHITVSLVIAGFAYILVNQIAGLVIGSESYSEYLKVSLFSFFFMQLNAIPIGFLRVQQKSVAYISASLANLLIGLFMNVYLIVVLQWGVWGVLYSNLISNAAIASFLLPFTFRQIGTGFDWVKLREMLNYGAPLIPAGLGNFSLNFSNRIFLSRFVSLGDLGVFTLGSRFAFMISVLVIQPFLDIWDAKMFEVKDRQDAKKLYARVLTYSTFVTLMAALGLSVVIEDVLKILVPVEFQEAYKVVPILCLGYFFQTFYYSFYVGLLLTKKTYWIAVILGLTAFVNLVLNALWIPAYGMLGAAWAMAISYLFMSGLTYFLAMNIYWVQYEWRRIATMTVVAVGLYGVLSRVTLGNDLLSLFFKTLGTMTFPVLLYLLGFFDLEERSILKKVSTGLTEKLTGRAAPRLSS